MASYTNEAYWFKVTLDTGIFIINVTNLPGVGKITKADVYTGTCASLSLVRTDTLMSTTDTTFNIYIYNTINPTSFYVKLYNRGGAITFSKTMATSVSIIGQLGFCPGQQVTLKAYPLNVNGTPTYTWLPGGANTSIITVTPSSTTTPTTYTLLYADGNSTLTTTGVIFPLGPNECKNCEQVQNGHFEWYNGYPTSAGNIADAQFWNNANQGSADYFNTNFTGGNTGVPSNFASTNAPAHSGKSYAGFQTFNLGISNFREYVQSQLKCPLIPGQKYNVSFYTITGDKFYVVTNNIGAYLSATPISTTTSTNLTYTPQINSNSIINYSTSWTQVSGSITGNNEQYITVGNFYSGPPNTSTTTSTSSSISIAANIAYYFVDDISVTPVTPTLSASSNTVNCNSASTITLTATGSPSLYTTWTDGTITYSGSVVSLPSPTITTTYTCNVNLSCSSCAILTETIVINVLNTPTLTASASPATICTGQSSTLTASGASTYTWNPGALTGSTVAVSPTVTTTYTVTGTNTVGCINTKTVVVTVNPLPILTVSTSPTLICAGQPSTLTASGASTYTWSPGSATGSTVSVTPTVTTNYTVSGTSALGCNNTKTVTLTVNALPSLTISPTTPSICVGQNTTLTASGANTYIWNTGPTTASINISPTVSTNYTVTGTNSVTGCSNTKSVTVTVVALPVLTITPSSSTVCLGQVASLTATGANTYTWAPVALTGSLVNVSPISNTIYTITGTSYAGCVNTQTASVTVNSLPSLTASSNPTLICSSHSSTLTAGGADTYTWSTGATTTSTSASPSVTTIYTVTGKTTATGCTNTQTVSVNVIPYAPILTASATVVSVCGSGSSTITASGASTYTWLPGSTTGSTLAVTPTVATVYTVSGNYSLTGCGTGSITIVVNPTISTLCCSAPTSTINGGYPASGTYTTSTAVVDVQGIVTFTGNTSYTGYTFRMAPGTLLQVYPNVTLTLNNCRLFGCNELWNGILLMEDNTNFGNLVLTNSTVEDMYNGIVVDYDNYTINTSAPSGSITISGSTLNKNYTSVKIKNSPGMSNSTGSYPFSMQTSTLSTATSSTSPGSTLKPSSTYTYAYNQITNGSGGSSAVYLNFPRSFIGIDLLNLGHESDVMIGSRTSSTLTNTFDNLDFGINALEAFPQVFNNYFKNINGSIKSTDPGINPAPPATGPDEIGIAVLVTQTTTANFNSCTVGDGTVIPTPDTSPFPHGNKFEDCNRGVKATNCRYVTVLGNAFTTNTTTIPVSTSSGQPPMPVINPNTYYYYTGQNAIWSSALGTQADLSSNYIRNHGTGIYSSHTLNSGVTQIDINENDIAAPSSTGWCKQAIQVAQAGGANLAADKLTIYNNNIENVYRGLVGDGVLSGLLIKENGLISVESTAKTLNYSATSQRTGIVLNNCEYASIKGNALTSNASSIPTTSTTAQYLNGTFLTGTKYGKVECNTATHLGRDFVFQGTCDNNWLANTMSDSYTGLEIRVLGRIGQQGASSGTPNLSANTWTTITRETSIISSAGNNTISPLYVLIGAGTTPTLNFGTAGHTYTIGPLQGIRTATTGTSYTCNAGSAQRISGENNTGSGLNKKTASETDSLTAYISLANSDANTYDVFTDEFIYQNKQLVYKLLDQDSIQPAGGSTLDNFYTANQNTAIAQLTEVQQAIANNDLNTAGSANASVASSNQAEYKHQRANDLMLKYLNNRFYTYTAGEKQDLYSFANECIIKGYYVVQARNIVNIISNQVINYVDACEEEANASRKSKPKTREAMSNTAFTLHPNPNNGIMEFQYNLGNYQKADFELLDVTGKILSIYHLESNEGKLFINEQTLHGGIYFYRILVEGYTIKTDKIVIIK